jgi:hypothetical protein
MRHPPGVETHSEAARGVAHPPGDGHRRADRGTALRPYRCRPAQADVQRTRLRHLAAVPRELCRGAARGASAGAAGFRAARGTARRALHHDPSAQAALYRRAFSGRLPPGRFRASGRAGSAPDPHCDRSGRRWHRCGAGAAFGVATRIGGRGLPPAAAAIRALPRSVGTGRFC